MSKLATHYANLQVTENASPEAIKGAYKYLSQKWHPDKNPTERAKAERVTKLINAAYEVLSDPVKRRAHDLWIAEQRRKEISKTTLHKPPVYVPPASPSPPVYRPASEGGIAYPPPRHSNPPVPPPPSPRYPAPHSPPYPDHPPAAPQGWPAQTPPRVEVHHHHYGTPDISRDERKQLAELLAEKKAVATIVMFIFCALMFWITSLLF